MTLHEVYLKPGADDCEFRDHVRANGCKPILSKYDTKDERYIIAVHLRYGLDTSILTDHTSVERLADYDYENWKSQLEQLKHRGSL